MRLVDVLQRIALKDVRKVLAAGVKSAGLTVTAMIVMESAMEMVLVFHCLTQRVTALVPSIVKLDNDCC